MDGVQIRIGLVRHRDEAWGVCHAPPVSHVLGVTGAFSGRKRPRSSRRPPKGMISRLSGYNIYSHIELYNFLYYIMLYDAICIWLIKSCDDVSHLEPQEAVVRTLPACSGEVETSFSLRHICSSYGIVHVDRGVSPEIIMDVLRWVLSLISL